MEGFINEYAVNSAHGLASESNFLVIHELGLLLLWFCKAKAEIYGGSHDPTLSVLMDMVPKRKADMKRVEEWHARLKQ